MTKKYNLIICGFFFLLTGSGKKIRILPDPQHCHIRLFFVKTIFISIKKRSTMVKNYKFFSLSHDLCQKLKYLQIQTNIRLHKYYIFPLIFYTNIIFFTSFLCDDSDNGRYNFDRPLLVRPIRIL